MFEYATNPSPAPRPVVPPIQTIPLAPPPIAPDAMPAAGPRLVTALEVRIWSLLMLAIAGSMLVVGMWLQPSPDGLGTHRELGLPPCDFFERTGYPCPTCGCTTAVTYFAHGHWIDSFLTQPFGFMVGVLGLAAVCFALGLITGRWKGPSPEWLAWNWKWLMWCGVGILIGAWVYKIILIRNGINPIA